MLIVTKWFSSKPYAIKESTKEITLFLSWLFVDSAKHIELLDLDQNALRKDYKFSVLPPLCFFCFSASYNFIFHSQDYTHYKFIIFLI